jgi:hypothetical protein
MGMDFEDCKKDEEPALAITAVLEIIAVMEHCLQDKHEGVVIIGKTIDTQIIAFACLYLMIKYRWNSQEAFDFIRHRFPDAQLLPAYSRILDSFSSHR